MICMFSHWIEAFPYRRATALTVDKLLFERVIPVCGTLSELYSNQGTHFTRQIIKSICNIWAIRQHFHCAHHLRYKELTALPKLNWQNFQKHLISHGQKFCPCFSTLDLHLLVNISCLLLN